MVFDIKSGLGDPESVLDIFPLLRDDSIADEIQFEKNDREEVLELLEENSLSFSELPMAKRNGGTKSAEVVTRRIAKINQLLDPRQRDRLKEIAYRLEIKLQGIVCAVAKGFLGKRMGLTENQIAELQRNCESLEGRLNDGNAAIAIGARMELLKELEPLQQQKLDILLGKPFNFRE